jgi:hypothetical protein
MTIPVTGFVNPQAIMARIDTTGHYSELYICTGIALLDISAVGEVFILGLSLGGGGWAKGDLVFLIPDAERSAVEDASPCLVFWPGEVGTSIVPAAWVASFGSGEGDFGFAVDEVHATWDSSSGRIEVTAKVAVKGDPGTIYRLGYHVSFLAHLNKNVGPDGRYRLP